MKLEALEVLENRRSIRHYTEQPVAAELLERVLRAGTYAPTAKNLQQPIIVSASDPEICAVLRRLNAEAWGKPEADPYYGAPNIVIVFAPDSFTGRMDAAAVLTNMLNAAYAVGLGSCWINRPLEMFSTEEGRALMAKWGLPADYIGVCSMSLGYPDRKHPTPLPRKEGWILQV